MEYFFPITSLIIHNYKYIYYKSIYNFVTLRHHL